MNTSIKHAPHQILDTRTPTTEADVALAGRAIGWGSVPSGVATGSADAHEPLDGDSQAYGGLGA